MKISSEQISSDLLNLHPNEQPGIGSTRPLVSADCADDAPC